MSSKENGGGTSASGSSFYVQGGEEAVDSVAWVTVDGGGRSGAPHARTAVQDNPWWEVDLGSEHAISSVEIWGALALNREAPYPPIFRDEPLVPLVVSFLDSEGVEVLRTDVGEDRAQEAWLVVAGPQLLAATVRCVRIVALGARRRLALLEVRVWAHGAWNCSVHCKSLGDEVAVALHVPPGLPHHPHRRALHLFAQGRAQQQRLLLHGQRQRPARARPSDVSAAREPCPARRARGRCARRPRPTQHACERCAPGAHWRSGEYFCFHQGPLSPRRPGGEGARKFAPRACTRGRAAAARYPPGTVGHTCAGDPTWSQQLRKPGGHLHPQRAAPRIRGRQFHSLGLDPGGSNCWQQLLHSCYTLGKEWLYLSAVSHRDRHRYASGSVSRIFVTELLLSKSQHRTR